MTPNISLRLHGYFRDTRDPHATLAAFTEKRWVEIEDQLKALQKQVDKLRAQKGLPIQNMEISSHMNTKNEGFKDLVIEMDPKFPSQAIVYLAKKLSKTRQVLFAQHVHSSCQNKVLQKFWPLNKDQNKSRLEYDLVLTLIWKTQNYPRPTLKSAPTGQKIVGEPNVLRYLARLITGNTKAEVIYPETCSKSIHWIDAQLDNLYELSQNSNKTSMAKIINKTGKRPINLESSITLADLYYQSLIIRDAPEVKSILDPIFVHVALS